MEACPFAHVLSPMAVELTPLAMVLAPIAVEEFPADEEAVATVAILDALSRGRLVGRAAELTEAIELWHRAREGHGHAVLFSGEPGAVIDGSLATHTLRIDADDVTVRGLVFRNVSPSHVEDRAAIRVGAVHGCRIEDNRIENAFFGIYLAGTNGCRVARNELVGGVRTEDRSGNGIHLWSARDIDVIDNRITGHRDGIYLEFTHETRVSGNTSERNLRYGMHFMYSDGCRYEHNVFRDNSSGVAVMYTRGVVMADNRFEGNWGSAAYGLLLKEIYDAQLSGNRFVRNTTALVADGATRLVADSNVFEENGWALRLLASTQDASFTGNSFVSPGAMLAMTVGGPG